MPVLDGGRRDRGRGRAVSLLWRRRRSAAAAKSMNIHASPIHTNTHSQPCHESVDMENGMTRQTPHSTCSGEGEHPHDPSPTLPLGEKGRGIGMQGMVKSLHDPLVLP